MTDTSLAANHEAVRLEEVADSLPEIRCRRCRRRLMKGEVKKIEIKCPKCGCVQEFQGSRLLRK